MDEPGDEARAHGELGEEIQRLVTAAQQWAQEWARGSVPGEPATAEPGGPPHGSHGERSDERVSSCPVWCPICQFVNVLQGEHPEVADRLAEASGAIANALRAVVDAAAARVSPAAPAPAPERPRPSPGVQRIHLDDPAES